MIEEENKDEKEEKKNKRPEDLSKLNDIGSGWECSVDTGSC